MITEWDYSLDSETNRLLEVLHQTANGFYKINGFYPGPLNRQLKSDSTVPIPDLDFLSIPGFWKKVQQIKLNKSHEYKNSSIFSQIKKLLSDYPLPKPNYEKVQAVWQEAQNDVLAEIFRIIPTKKDFIPKIIIYPTVFGTTSSFNILKSKDDVLTIYLRHDQNIFAITESILTALLVEDIYTDFSGLWQEVEILTDWLTTRSSISPILSKYTDKKSFKPTMSLLRDKYSNEFKKQSDYFYKKLGLRISEDSFVNKAGKIMFNDKKLHNLTHNEQKILHKLIETKIEGLNYDNLGFLLYGNKDFSLYAVNKVIERLRKKLELNGISGSYIQTIRGYGFVLRN